MEDVFKKNPKTVALSQGKVYNYFSYQINVENKIFYKV